MTIQETMNEYKRTVEALKDLAQIKRTIPQAVIAQRHYEIPSTGRKAKYPWAAVKVDKSFLVRCAPTAYHRERVMNSLTSCISNVRRKTGMNFVQRTDPKGVRVWRIE